MYILASNFKLNLLLQWSTSSVFMAHQETQAHTLETTAIEVYGKKTLWLELCKYFSAEFVGSVTQSVKIICGNCTLIG